MYVAEAGRLDGALSEAKTAFDAAFWAVENAKNAIEAHNRHSGNPLGWANGEKIEREGGLRHGFISYDCPICETSGTSADGTCIKCADERGDGGAKNLVNIYQTL